MNNVEKFYDGREIIINAFWNKTFPLNYEESDFEDKDDITDENNPINYKELDRLIYLKETDIKDELVRKRSLVPNLRAFLKKLKKLRKQKKKENSGKFG